MHAYIGLRLVVFIALLHSVVLAIRTDQQTRSRCWSSGNSNAARWWREGDRIDRGKYWYECRRGQLEPRGCFDVLGNRIPTGDKYIDNGYELQCSLDSSGYLHYTFTACIVNAKHYSVAQTWEDEQHMYWFECRKDGPYLKVDIRGCLTHDKTRRIKLDDKYDLGDYTYQCLKKYNGTVQMCSVGCIHKAAHYKIGAQWPDGDFIYYCKTNHGRAQKICVGCQFKDKSLYDGDRYRKGNTVFQCEVRPDQYGHKPVACVTHDLHGATVERIVGCRWYQQTKHAKIEQTCVLENNRTVVKTLGCVFVYKGYDTLFLLPDTYTIWNQQLDGDSLGVICRNTQDGDIPILETFRIADIAHKAIGLKYDQPRGK